MSSLPQRSRAGSRGRWTVRVLVVLAVITVVALLFGGGAISFYVNVLWFGTLGYTRVYLTRFVASTILFTIGFVVFLVLFMPSVLAAAAAARRFLRQAPVHLDTGERSPWSGVFGAGGRNWDDGPRPLGDLAELFGGASALRGIMERSGSGLLWIIGVLLALLMGLTASGEWGVALRALHQTPFPQADPIFGLNIAFYVFLLPFLEFWQSWLFWALLLTILTVLGIVLLALYALDPTWRSAGLYLRGQAHGLRTHLLWLTALLIVVIAAGQWLGLYDVLMGQHQRMVGATYTDVHARIPATEALIAATLLLAVLVVASSFRNDLRLALIGLVVAGAMLVVGRGVLPVLVQRLQVEPAELARERPYIAYDIAATRAAYGLTGVQDLPFPAADAVQPEEIRNDQDTIRNVRLWDPKLLKDTYNQVQSIRPYYLFDDIDVDRYLVDGRERQVMLSARELVSAQLGAQAQTWVNERLQYTHGYGLAMSPVNEVTTEGLPTFFIKDLPPAGQIPVVRPEVYFGEQIDTYAIVDTNAQEFDYPRGEENVFTSYAAPSGVPVGGMLQRFLLSWYLGDFNLLVSGYVKPQSRVLIRRDVVARVQQIAPFLKLDQDPYLVLADGQLFWMVDAYTTTDQYPYSRETVERYGAPAAPTTTGSPDVLGPRYAYNYIRNSVKITVNAYDGSVHFYIADPSDPLVQTYAGIFPDLFLPLRAMPADLAAHIRYPEDLFQVQSQLLRVYHVEDPQVFYNGEDVWSFAFEGPSSAQRQVVAPYYLIMRLPGETQAEFVLVIPFTPLRRDNMTAWLAARMDGSSYGNLRLYRFPRDRLVYGPAQIQARIDQDPQISAQLTLWNQQGSKVERGNLMVIPIGNSMLYVQPIYLLAERSHLPELKRIVVATGNKLAMEATLDEALLKLFGAASGVPVSGPATAPTTPSQPVPGLGTGSATLDPASVTAIRAAQDAYARAQSALRAGDLAAFGEALNQVGQALSQLNTGSGAGSGAGTGVGTSTGAGNGPAAAPAPGAAAGSNAPAAPGVAPPRPG